MTEDLSQDNVKWLMERQVDSYLAWVAIWLVCLLGNATILTSLALNTSTLSSAKLGVIIAVYLGLIGGMVFSVTRLGFIMQEHITLENRLQDKALRNYVLDNRRFLSKFAVNRDGVLRKLNLALLCILHFVIFLLLFYLVM